MNNIIEQVRHEARERFIAETKRTFWRRVWCFFSYKADQEDGWKFIAALQSYDLIMKTCDEAEKSNFTAHPVV